jgi:hypothetical protein
MPTIGFPYFDLILKLRRFGLRWRQADIDDHDDDDDEVDRSADASRRRADAAAKTKPLQN